MAAEGGQGQGVRLLLLLQNFWLVHLSGIRSRKWMEECVGPAGVALGAQSQIMGQGNHGCWRHMKLASGQVGWCDLGRGDSPSFSRSLLAAGPLGALGPSVLGTPIHAGQFSPPALLRLLTSVSGSWPHGAPSLLGLDAFLRRGQKSRLVLADGHRASVLSQ